MQEGEIGNRKHGGERAKDMHKGFTLIVLVQIGLWLVSTRSDPLMHRASVTSRQRLRSNEGFHPATCGACAFFRPSLVLLSESNMFDTFVFVI